MYQHFKLCIGLQNLATDADAINAEIVDIISNIIKLLPTAAEMDDTARAIEFLKSFVAGSEKYFWRTIKNSTTGRKEDICHYTARRLRKISRKRRSRFSSARAQDDPGRKRRFQEC